MPYELFLALRYMRARRGGRVARWTALAAVAGIACGVAALVLATAVANGFREELRDKILRGTAHVTLSREGGMRVGEAAAAAARVRRLAGVRDAAATTYEGALLSGPAGAAYTLLRGVDPDAPRALAELRRATTAGAPDALAARAEEENAPLPVVVGEELAARTGLARVGEEGWVLTGELKPGGAGFEPRARRVRVAGLFRSGLYDYDSAWTYAPLEAVGLMANGAPATAVVSVEGEDPEGSAEVARRARAELGAGWSALDWREANRPLFAALELERRTVALIIMLITVVAALNITTTLALVV
ncbi:MAG TPA: ABC transporter permease, partial [Pyrinomonadaceae bacterium]